MTDAEILATLAPVRFEPGCMVEPDPGEVVRHAAPLDDRAAHQMREQAIARMRRDPEAIRARERRINTTRSGVLPFRRQA